jgi:hypothetical protein
MMQPQPIPLVLETHQLYKQLLEFLKYLQFTSIKTFKFHYIALI